MNKKFLSAILFGALMVSSTGTFVSLQDTNVPVDETIKAPNRIALKTFLFIIEKL